MRKIEISNWKRMNRRIIEDSMCDEPKSVATAARLLEEADQLSKARLLASASRESGLWLHALPVPSLGTLLDAESFSIAIALRVGADVSEPHVCRCGRRMGYTVYYVASVLDAILDIQPWMMSSGEH